MFEVAITVAAVYFFAILNHMAESYEKRTGKNPIDALWDFFKSSKHKK